ncbi:RES domain-containing protein [Paenibacillus sp. FSL H8-0283]|uniref:RES domain-containing protein n=1 Tax=Paenibacillus sp. FSL H8-0283 TaxID=2921383 RepID=UPI0032435C3A
MNCCVNCFNDEEIIEQIAEKNDIQNCDFCDSESVYTIAVEELGLFIREGFERAYEHVEEFTGAMWDSENSSYISGNGQEAGGSVLDILYWENPIFSDLHDTESASKLLSELIDSTGLTMSDIQDGCIDHLSDIFNPCFVFKNDLFGVESTSEYSSWENFKHLCKYYNRYFDVGTGNTHREDLLNKLGDLFQLMGRKLEINTVLFRARKYEMKDKNENWYREISPAPAKYAVNNRMSPAGISYTYLATHIETTLKEIRANKGDHVLIGELQPIFELDILDLTKEIEIKTKSIFRKDYNHNDNWVNEFISNFIAEISKPINENEKNIEYVATQLLSEYIRKLGFDGIKFESSIASGTYNYVLFCGPNTDILRDSYEYEYYTYNNDYELVYFNKWLKLKSIRYIECEETCEYQELIHTDTIDDINKSLFPNGSENFVHINQIYNQLEELNQIILKDYDFYDHNELIPNFNLIEVMRELIDGNNQLKRVMYISITTGFNFININVGMREGLYKNKCLAYFTCYHRTIKNFEDILLPVDLSEFNSKL